MRQHWKMNLFPPKGRSEGDASENDSIIFCIKYTKPVKEQNCSHLFSIIPGKEPAKEHETTLENEVTNRRAKNSTN